MNKTQEHYRSLLTPKTPCLCGKGSCVPCAVARAIESPLKGSQLKAIYEASEAWDASADEIRALGESFATKTERIDVRVTAKELRRLKVMAAAKAMSVSELMLWSVFNADM